MSCRADRVPPARESGTGHECSGSGFVFVSPASPGPTSEAFRRGLRESGDVEGQTVAVEPRFAEGRSERLPGLVDELIDITGATFGIGGAGITGKERRGRCG